MFLLTKIEDLVRIKPSNFKQPQYQALRDELNRKYSNKVLHNVGLCIKVYDIESATDPIIHACQDGSYQVTTVFRMIVFRPAQGQVLMGKIKECDQQKGVVVNMEFFDDIYIPPAYLMENSEFNVEENCWVWKYGDDELFMDPGNWIRFRIEQLEFVDSGPLDNKEPGKRKAPFTIYASCGEQGLGLVDWWQ